MIQIFLLTYNRPDLVGHTTKSILSQSLSAFELIISDNSTNDETQILIQDQFKEETRLVYKKRTTSIPPIDHFNKVISEVTAEYFILFHDDDIMHPQMLQLLFDEIKNDESLSAVGCNAFVIKRRKSKGLFRNEKHNSTIIANRSELITQYLGNQGCVPFPSYLYRKSKVEGVFMDIENGGKYCDVSFLMAVCDRGKMVWLNQPQMDYYIHNGQSSKTDNFVDRLKLIGHITSTTTHGPSSKIVKAYRLINIYGELRNRLHARQKVGSKRIAKAALIALINSPTKAFPRMIYLFSMKLSFRYATCRL